MLVLYSSHTHTNTHTRHTHKLISANLTLILSITIYKANKVLSHLLTIVLSIVLCEFELSCLVIGRCDIKASCATIHQHLDMKLIAYL